MGEDPKNKLTVIENNASVDCDTAVALGVFDGVHLGHRAVIGAAREYAVKSSACENVIAPAVCTFKTATINTKGADFLPIFGEEKKLGLLVGEGVKFVYNPDFALVRDMSAEEFVRDILKKKLRARAAVCGRDFRLGKNAACGVTELEEICKGFGITLIAAEDVRLEGEKISSARLRRLILQGDITAANRLLGVNYSVDGEIVTGNKFGRQLNFPTANQVIEPGTVCPKFGVYVSRAMIDGREIKGITNIGVKPTVGYEGTPLAETHFLGFSGDLYGRKLSVELLSFLRPEQRFTGADELKNRICRDIEEAEKFREI
ncbi:MAG: riboflavin biosynthesis protein RibF [Oscillospiraceae bacterium]|nr:riboflavin biosynthesis protein RibF [Oscillospiraceae bacterium]